MKCLLVNQFFPPDVAPTGRLLADVADYLVTCGHEVHVLCSRGLYGGGIVERTDRCRQSLRIHRIGASARGRAGALDRLCDWGSFYALAWERSTRLGRFDACLALTTPPFIAAVGARLKRVWGTRLVVWAMDLWPEIAEALGALRPDGATSRVLKTFARITYERADAVLSLGWRMTERLVASGVDERKIVPIHHWVPGESVRPMPREASLLGPSVRADPAFVLMYSGNLGLAHEFDTVLDAASLLEREGGFLLLFAGEGKRLPEVREGARHRGLRNVRFMPPQPTEQLAGLLASADVHLVTMRPGVEGLVVPSKIYGILAAGRPAVLIGPAGNEIAELLSASGGGIVIPNGDAAKLAEYLRRLRDRPELAASTGRSGRDYYQSHLGRDRALPLIRAALEGSLPP